MEQHREKWGNKKVESRLPLQKFYVQYCVAKDVKCLKVSLNVFLSHVQEVCPWFPDEETINLKTWEKVGQRLKDHYTSEGPTCVPVDAFYLWNLIRDCLDPHHEVTTISSPKAEISKWEVDVQTSPSVSL
jgi:hypothetical protein